MFIALVKKELLALSRDLHGLAALFVMPAIFIVVMSLALQNYYSPSLAPMRYAIDARDTDAPARLIVAAWQRAHGPAVPLPADWQAELKSGRLNYVITLAPGLSDVLDAPSLPTEPRIELRSEPG
ncbi:MAG: ABC transporter permease, partial [Variovorax sp.]